MKDETLVYFGDAVKALGDGKVGGYLVRFGSPDQPDLEGEYFTTSTDFGGATKTAVYYNHGLDERLKRRVLGQGDIEIDDVGVWIEAQMELRDEYERAIYEMAEQGKLGWSSGTAGHLTERIKAEDGEVYQIARWPLGLDASLTPTPAEPRTLAVTLKSLTAQAADKDAGDASEAAPEVDASDAKYKREKGTNNEVAKMTTSKQYTAEEIAELLRAGNDALPEDRAKLPEVLKSYEDQVAGVKADMAKMTETLDMIANSPALKDAGYVAPDSETDHGETKSFGDFLVALRNGNTKRLQNVYKAALDGSTGPTGGYLIPTEFASVMEKQIEELSVFRRAFPGSFIQMGSREVEVPVLDLEDAPSAGDSAMAGGAIGYWVAEAGSITQSEPDFKLIRLVAHKLAAYSLASSEVRQDARESVDGMLSRAMSRAIASKENYAFLRGDGVAKPKGVLESGALISATRSAASTVALADISQMMSDFIPESYTSGAFFINPVVFDQLIQLVTNPITWIENARTGLPNSLLGLPLYVTGALPALNTAGDILLMDGDYYMIGDRGGLEIAVSEHFRFQNDQLAWRVTKRVDGQPLIDSSVTLENASDVVSPFVVLAAG